MANDLHVWGIRVRRHEDNLLFFLLQRSKLCHANSHSQQECGERHKSLAGPQVAFSLRRARAHVRVREIRIEIATSNLILRGHVAKPIRPGRGTVQDHAWNRNHKLVSFPFLALQVCESFLSPRISCGKAVTSPTDFGSHGGERKAKEGKEATGLSEALTSVGQPLYVGQLLLGLFELFDQVIAADHLLITKGTVRQVSGVSKFHQSTMMSNTSNDVYSRICPQM